MKKTVAEFDKESSRITAGQEEYIRENFKYNKYFLINVDIRSKEQQLSYQNLAL